MFKSKIKKRYRKSVNARFYQGDILKDIEFVVGDTDKNIEKDRIDLPYSLIFSQDCDLQSDYKGRKERRNQNNHLLSVLLCPAFKLEDFAQGTHLDGWHMEIFPDKAIEKIKKNDTYKRYHYIKGDTEYSVPDLIVDFKYFFTVPRDFLYNQKKEKYVASLSELFREELSQRFSNFLSRIGLPEI